MDECKMSKNGAAEARDGFREIVGVDLVLYRYFSWKYLVITYG